MTQQNVPTGATRGEVYLQTPPARLSGWNTYGSIMLMISGVFSFLVGLIHVSDDTFYTNRITPLFTANMDAWGWWWMIVGVVGVIAGIACLTNPSMMSRTFGIAVCAVSAVSMFIWLPIFYVYALVIIAADVLAIHALVAHGDPLRR